MSGSSAQFEFQVANPVSSVLAQDLSNEDWSHCLKRLFSVVLAQDLNNEDWSHCLKRLFSVVPAQDLSNENWSHCLKHLFSVPRVDFIAFTDEDWSDVFQILFRIPKPYYQLDLDAIRAGPALFGNAYFAQDEYYSEGDWDFDESIPSYKVRACRGGKKATRHKAGGSRKCTRRQKREFPDIRAKKLVKKSIKGGVYKGLPINHGSYGGFGFEF